MDKHAQNEWEIDNLPNRLTLFRILLIPVIVFGLSVSIPEGDLFSSETRRIWGWIAGLTFAVAAITDFFDGYFARKRNIITVFGSFLDPIADKFLVVSSLIMLLALSRVNYLVVTILVLREMYITSLRLLASQKGVNVPVDNWGKYKAASQMIGIPLLMANDTPLGIPMGLIGTAFIYISCFLSIFSALRYSMKLYSKFKLLKYNQKQETTDQKEE